MNEKPVKTEVDFNEALKRIAQYPKELLPQSIRQKKDDLRTPETKQRAPITSKKNHEK